MSKTARVDNAESLSVVGVKNSSTSERLSTLKPLRMESESHLDPRYALMENSELRPEYKKEISTLLPIRKPVSRKDYFVFGLSDRTSTS
jgi:hypothetical protein